MDNKEVKELLSYLSWYTCEIFERKTKHYLQVLEDNAEENGDAVKKAVVKAAGFLPFSDFGSLLDQASDKVTGKLLDIMKLSSKKEASALERIIYDVKELSKLDGYKKILIEVCFELFRSFEYQFVHLTCQNGGEKRAMFKLGDHIVNVVLRHFVLRSDEKPEFTVRELLAAIVNDEKEIKDQIRKFGMKIVQSELKTSKREVMFRFGDKSRCVETDELLTETGLLTTENGERKYFTRSEKSPKDFGYRRLFWYETDSEDILDSYQEDGNYFSLELDTYEFIFDFSCKDQQVEETWTFIKKQDPKKMEERLKGSMDEVSAELVKVQNFLLARERHLVNLLCTQMVVVQDSNQDIKDIKQTLKGIEGQLERNQRPAKAATPSNSCTAVFPQMQALVQDSLIEKRPSAAKMINRRVKDKIASKFSK